MVLISGFSWAINSANLFLSLAAIYYLLSLRKKVGGKFGDTIGLFVGGMSFLAVAFAWVLILTFTTASLTNITIIMDTFSILIAIAMVFLILVSQRLGEL